MIDRRELLLALLAVEGKAAQTPRIERASDYAGELLRIVAPAGVKHALVRKGSAQERIDLLCERECTGVYATSYNDPATVMFFVGDTTLLAHQRQRPIAQGILYKPHVEYTPQLLARIQKETAQKREAYATRTPEVWNRGFQLPVKGRGDPFGKLRRVQYKDKQGRIVLAGGKPKEDLKTHEGADIPAVRGTPVLAALDGLVTLARKGFFYDGNMVILGSGSITTTYLHLDMIGVEAGQRVKHGEQIGTVGSNGYGVTGPHLHWAAKYQGRIINPYSLEILAR